MDPASKSDRLVRFSVYELDRDSGELFKQGRKIKLQGQPFELLLALLDRPGEVLTREELRQRIWSSETAGDFDQGLNRAVNKLREALGDSAENPRFIETLPRRGYRFIGSIQEKRIDQSESPGSPPPAIVEPSTRVATERQVISRRDMRISGAIAALILVAAAGVWLLVHHSTASNGPIQLQQLTTNSFENPILNAVISPDGKYLAYGDLTGLHIQLIGSHDTYTLPRPSAVSSADLWMPTAWFPDGTHLLASSEHSTPSEQTTTAWSVSTIGGTAVALRQGAVLQSISPDGSTIAFTTGSPARDWTSAWVSQVKFHPADIWLMNAHGSAARKVVAAGSGVLYIGSVRWSPDGKRIAYQEIRNSGEVTWNCSVKSIDMNGGEPTIIVTYPQAGVLLSQPADFAWLPDDRIVYAFRESSSSSEDTNLWQVKVDRRSGRAAGRPQKITNLVGFRMSALSYTTDSKHLAFESTREQSRIQLGRLETPSKAGTGKLRDIRLFTHDERNNAPWAFTADSKALIFSSDRTGKWAVYRQALDAEIPELIHTDPESVALTRLGPDGTYLIYVSSFRFMRAPVTGGPATFLFRDDSSSDFNCPQRSGLPCLINDVDADRKQQTFYSFDPVSGSRRELFKLFASSLGLANTSISPDGSEIAMLRYDTRAHVEIRSLDGQMKKKFDVKGWPSALSLDWAADGKALFISSAGLINSPSAPIGATLLRVDLEGNAQPIWDTSTGRASWGIASPDGKYLAIWEPALEGNIWRLDNF